jgi:type II secretory pathway component PulC
MPAKHRKRRISDESDNEDDFLNAVSLTVKEATSNTVIPEVKNLAERISNVPQAMVTAVRPKLDDISDAIASHHTETQYVHRKNNDQARMLAVLNERIEDKNAVIKEKDAVIKAKDAMIARLNAENAKLREDVRMVQETALADSTQLFEDIKKDGAKTKRDIKDIKALLKKNT